MSKEQKDHAIKIIFANEFRFEPDHIEYERMPTVAERVLNGCLIFLLIAIVVLSLTVGAIIFYA